MIEKHKSVCRDLIYFSHFLIFISVVSGCVSFFAFASLVGIHVDIASSAAVIKTSYQRELKSISQLSRRKRKSLIKCYWQKPN